MGETLDVLITLGIIIILILIVWSRIFNQRVLDTVNEIKQMVGGK